MGQGLRLYEVNSFPLQCSDDQVQVLAVFLTDHDARVNGTISYKVYTRSNMNMDTVSTFIQSNRGSTNFMGTWMIVVEWRDVPRYLGNDPKEVSNEIRRMLILLSNILSFP